MKNLIMNQVENRAARQPAVYTALLLALLCTALLLCGCGIQQAGGTEEVPAPQETEEPSPEPTPTPTPAPTPELLQFPDGTRHSADTMKLDLSSLRHGDVAETVELLKEMSSWGAPAEIDLGSDGAWTAEEEKLTFEMASVERPENADRDLTWEDIRALQDAAPHAEVKYRFRFFGRDFTTLDTEMDLSYSQMKDEGAAVERLLPCMQKLSYLDMDSCGVSSEKMAEIRDAHPEMDVVWRIWFGCHYYTLRTDVERILHSSFKAYMNDVYCQELKYCTKVRFLDMGHNRDLHDWSFLSYMPDLEVCIITDSGWETLDMLKDCTKLEFLEVCPIGHTYVDLSPLEKLVNLEHLNICGLGDSDGWEVLLNMKKLKRLWIGYWTALTFPEGAIEQIREALPNTEINVTEQAAAVGSWRTNPDGSSPERYLLLREQFGYDDYWNIFPYPNNDPKANPPWYRG